MCHGEHETGLNNCEDEEEVKQHHDCILRERIPIRKTIIIQFLMWLFIFKVQGRLILCNQLKKIELTTLDV